MLSNLKAVQPRSLNRATSKYAPHVSAAKKQDGALEIRICTEGKTCRKQGSKEDTAAKDQMQSCYPLVDSFTIWQLLMTCAALLQLGQKQEALKDAIAAVEGWVRLIDCHYAVGQLSQAAEATLKAVDCVPGFKNSNEYK
eukprot:gene4911-34678_t